MAQFLTVRRVGADLPGWTQLVEHIPPIGSLVRFGCAPDERVGPAEANHLIQAGPWRVQALLYHFLCPTEAQDYPADALTVEALVVPLAPHEEALYQGLGAAEVVHAGKPVQGVLGL